MSRKKSRPRPPLQHAIQAKQHPADTPTGQCGARPHEVLILHHQDSGHPGVQLSNLALQQYLGACGASSRTLNWSASFMRNLGFSPVPAQCMLGGGLRLSEPCYTGAELENACSGCTHVLIGGGTVFEDACPSDPTYPLLRYLGDFVPESVVLCAFGAGFGHNPPPPKPGMGKSALK